MIRRPPRSTQSRSSAASDVYKRQGYSLPGGGPGLARKTVESFLGIPIQYYARVDFQTFEKMVDTIGGICIDVPYEIIIDPLGPHNTATLEAGYECINGSEALA